MRLNQELTATRVEIEMMAAILRYVNEQERRNPVLRIIRAVRTWTELLTNGKTPDHFLLTMVAM